VYERRATIDSRSLFKTGFIALVFIAGCLLFWKASGLLLLVFASILLALLLDLAGRFLAEHLPLSREVGIGLTAFFGVFAFALSSWLAGPSLVAQGGELGSDLGAALKSLEGWVMSIDEVEKQVERSSFDAMKLLPTPGGVLEGVGLFVGTTLGVLGNLVLALVISLYLALDPSTYRKGFIRLLPPAHRARAGDVIDDMALTLKRWIGGKALMMLVIGVLSYAGLLLIGVPLALLLAVIAGVTSFVPIIGPAIGGSLMILVAFSEGWQLAAWAAVLYLAIQTIESYLLLPLIQAKAVDLPAAVVIVTQVLMGLVFGVIGVMVATPITAVFAVLIKDLYVDDYLEARPSASQLDHAVET
jgi:predicted PurR-regulated permease PerM